MEPGDGMPLEVILLIALIIHKVKPHIKYMPIQEIQMFQEQVAAVIITAAAVQIFGQEEAVKV
jgi:hypothetical protein